jgi:hypothetical protein
VRLLLSQARLQAGHRARDLVAVGGVTLEIPAVVRDRVVEVAGVEIRARDVVDDVRVREDLVGLLQLGDARVVAAVGDRAHSLLEMGARLGALVGVGLARRRDPGDEQHPDDAASEVALSPHRPTAE